ncbi:MAG: FAD:protein FMN transferase [Sedimentisphaerales bacterium]|nr:FAD:protein FMN transferase [Sedimentisphaerales bacterium]
MKKTLFIVVIVALFLISSYKYERQPDKFSSGRIEKLGTFVEMTIYADSQLLAQQAVDSAVYAIDKAAKVMNTYDPSSELSLATEAAKIGPTEISEELYYILERSIYYNQLTHSAFDPSLPAMIDLWKNKSKADQLPTESEISQIMSTSVGCNFVKLHKAELGLPARLSISAPELRLNINAIAKGHIADLAAAELRKMPGIYAGMVNIGGEIICFNNRSAFSGPTAEPVSPYDPRENTTVYDDESISYDQSYAPTEMPPLPAEAGNTISPRSFKVGVQDPFLVNSEQAPESYSWELELQNGAVATSGNYRQYMEIQGKHYSHILDPRTGYPADANPSVTVVAPTCMDADALATALSVLTPQEGIDLIETLPDTEAMIISGTKEDSKIYRSSGFNNYLAR